MLSSTMKSVGETMAIGRTFTEAIGKAWRGIEKSGARPHVGRRRGGIATTRTSRTPRETRLHAVADALAAGATSRTSRAESADRPVVRRPDRPRRRAATRVLRDRPLHTLGAAGAARGQARSASPMRASVTLTGATEAAVRRHRDALGVQPVFKTVDTCAGEFPARTPYHYSTYETEHRGRVPRSARGSSSSGAGPNRIGQGIEFDYACVHAAFALEEAGFDSVMLNSNPETVSTDYDTSSRLYFEPLAAEDVLAVCRRRAAVRRDRAVRRADPAATLRAPSRRRGSRSWAPARRRSTSRRTAGSSPRSCASSRSRRRRTARRARSAEARGDRRADRLPGRRAALVRARGSRDGDRLRRRRARAVRPDRRRGLARPSGADRPVPRGRDRGRRRRGVRRGRRRVHRRGDGAHRGGGRALRRLVRARSRRRRCPTRSSTRSRTSRFAWRGASASSGCSTSSSRSRTSGSGCSRPTRAPRAPCRSSRRSSGSRSRAWRRSCSPGARSPICAPTGIVPEQACTTTARLPYTSVKAAVLPFGRFPGVDTMLGPEMKSTGEVMGIDADSGMALAKAMVAAGHALPVGGIGVRERREPRQARDRVPRASGSPISGFRLLATGGTAGVLERAGHRGRTGGEGERGTRQHRRVASATGASTS